MNTNNVPTICLTGGPCAGKTTILSRLQERLDDLGFAVVVVPEVATEFISSGIRPALIEPHRFQCHILEHIMAKEDRFKALAQIMSVDKKVVICDRGAVDAAAYMSPMHFDLMLGQLGLTVVDLRDARYDGVVFLRSVAVDAPHIYTCDNNKARRESVEEACLIDECTLAAWTGHPHLRVIDNSTDLEGKSHRVLQAICRVLGIPTPLEIEKKYLVTQCDLSRLPLPHRSVEIEQYYLKTEDGKGVERIRRRSQGGGFTYYHTVKQDLRSGVRIENESQITEAEFLILLQRADPEFGKIGKTRYCFLWNNQYFELDVFHNPSGLVLLEIELTEENDLVILPDFLVGHVMDVTGSDRYSNVQIARRIVAGV